MPADEIKAEFSSFYGAYPRHVGPKDAERAYRKARRQGISADVLLAGAKAAARHHAAAKTEQRFIPHPATWINGGRWRDEYPPLDGQQINGRAARYEVEHDPAYRGVIA
jgi:hypothetical protein